ncbi:MAG: DUF3383 domain-containing protein [Planctomycetes bacterium]|nr:DUF3383 domain-containing protein [Planctomycetota bacterium]
MPIPASFIVDVQPRVISSSGGQLEFNGLFFSKNELISATSEIIAFGSVESVGDYFGIGSDEYAVAQTYFAGYVNKATAPRAILFARRIDDIIPSWVRSGRNTNALATYRSVRDGSITVAIDGVTYSVTGVDFSSATSFSDVGALLAEAIAKNGGDDSGPAVTCTYSSVLGAFTLESPTIGAASSVDFPQDGATGTGLATLMAFTEEQGAVQSKGSAALSVQEQMAAITDKTRNWVTFTTMWEADIEEMKEYTAWNATNYGYQYVPYTTQATAVAQDSTADPNTVLKALGENNTAGVVYGHLRHAACLMGAIASISWLRTNGTITLAFKTGPGLEAFVTSRAEAEVLTNKGYNPLTSPAPTPPPF